MKMLLRILGVLIVIAIIVGGYYLIKNTIESKKQKEYLRFAGVISEVSVAAELYRNDNDSFLIVRDSILKTYNLTLDDISGFRHRLKDNRREWLEVWKYVKNISDSLVGIHQARLNIGTDSAVDSLEESKE